MGLLLPNENKEDGKKKFKKDISAIMGDVSSLNKNRIYNYGYVKKPAELFRKDLISAMKMADGEQLSPEDYLLITDHWKEEWEKGVQVPVNPDSLPEPSFRFLKKEQDSHSQDTNKVKTLKKINKTDETDLEVYGQYELDLLDLAWLQTLHESDESIKLPEKFVEDLINELEHQCARNMKAKQVGIEYDDHVLCDVCRSPDAEDGNEMVFCDSCNICVHQACYGITHIPDGEWLCRPCKELGYKKDLPCILCPNSGGALKPTSHSGEWAHVACALWIPEVNIGCVKSMEPITKTKQISPTRLNLVCSLCKIKKGAPIQCSVNSCKVAYHVTCAFNAKLKMNVFAVDDKKGVKLKSYCSKHSSKDSPKDNESGESSCEEKKEDSFEELTIIPNDSDDPCNEFWKYIDITQINQEFLPMLITEFPQSSKESLLMYIDLVLQYWKMKRVSNYGSPLIRMINSTSLERLKLQQHAGILRFRVDLERIRNLSYMLCRREKIKSNWVKTHQQTIENAIAFATGSPLPSCDDQPESTTTSSISYNYKTNAPQEERMKVAKEVINSSCMYDDYDIRDKNKPKVLIKQIRNMMRNDNIEKLRRHHRPNPYLKFYPQRRSESSDNGKSQQSPKSPQSPQLQQKAKGSKSYSTFNGSHKNHNGQTKVNGFPILTSLPLRSKSVPINQTSPKSESIRNTLREKSITKSDNQITISSKSSPTDPIKEDKIVNNSVITRASALIGYRIPKKNRDNHKESDRVCRDESNYTISPLKNFHNEQRVSVSPNHHFLRRPTMEDNSYKGNERFLERRRSFNQRRF
ncbi:protein Jade-1-like isoform X2 [Panonychus citri]|nr:protein Jade-1-like isoform X2 [Panonychus citri]